MISEDQPEASSKRPGAISKNTISQPPETKLFGHKGD
jgi:hypothetical protein